MFTARAANVSPQSGVEPSMSRGRDVAVYALLILLSVGFVAWQWFEHDRYRSAARQRLVRIGQNMSRSLEIVVGSQRRRGGIIPREPLEGALAALVEQGPMLAIAVVNSDNKIIARSGDPFDLTPDQLAPGNKIWKPDSLTIVQLAQLGNFAPKFSLNEKGSDAAAIPSKTPSEPIVMDRETAHQFMREFYEKHREEEGEASPEDGGFDQSMHRFIRGMGAWRGSLAPDVLRQYGLSKLVLRISTAPIAGHIQRDLLMRSLLSGAFVLALAAVGWGWFTTRRSAALNLQLVRAQEMNRHLQEMNLAAAGLAHETKNPLNVIRGLAQTVSVGETTTEGVRAKSDLMVREVDAVTNRLNEFIEYAKPRPPNLQAIALLDVIRDTARVLEADFAEKKILFGAEGESLIVQADADLARQAVFNLLLNACQMLEQGGAIHCRIARDAEGICLRVSDDGPGVPTAKREEIFKPYYTLRAEGTGLGLALVRQIVQSHGWSITCGESDKGGAEFVITGIATAPKDSEA